MPIKQSHAVQAILGGIVVIAVGAIGYRLVREKPAAEKPTPNGLTLTEINPNAIILESTSTADGSLTLEQSRISINFSDPSVQTTQTAAQTTKQTTNTAAQKQADKSR